jgi:hypothetical protein
MSIIIIIIIICRRGKRSPRRRETGGSPRTNNYLLFVLICSYLLLVLCHQRERERARSPPHRHSAWGLGGVTCACRQCACGASVFCCSMSCIDPSLSTDLLPPPPLHLGSLVYTTTAPARRIATPSHMAHRHVVWVGSTCCCCCCIHPPKWGCWATCDQPRHATGRQQSSSGSRTSSTPLPPPTRATLSSRLPTAAAPARGPVQ